MRQILFPLIYLGACLFFFKARFNKITDKANTFWVTIGHGHNGYEISQEIKFVNNWEISLSNMMFLSCE